MTGKYHAKKVKADGYVFDSMAEHKRYCELKVLERAGEIIGLRIHPKYDLIINKTKIGVYTGDFDYTRKSGDFITEDVKGRMTEAASLRLRVFHAIYGRGVTIIGKAAKLRKFKA